MAGSIYKLWMFKNTEAWYQLSEEERNKHMTKVNEALEKVGGRRVITCVSVWSSEQWLAFGVDEFPDIEAIQKFADELYAIDQFRYVESMSMLGIKWAPE